MEFSLPLCDRLRVLLFADLCAALSRLVQSLGVGVLCRRLVLSGGVGVLVRRLLVFAHAHACLLHVLDLVNVARHDRVAVRFKFAFCRVRRLLRRVRRRLRLLLHAYLRVACFKVLRAYARHCRRSRVLRVLRLLCRLVDRLRHFGVLQCLGKALRHLGKVFRRNVRRPVHHLLAQCDGRQTIPRQLAPPTKLLPPLVIISAGSTDASPAKMSLNCGFSPASIFSATG